MLEKGIGVEKDLNEARSLYMKAYALGSQYGLGNLCRLNVVGINVGGTPMIAKCMQLKDKFKTGLSDIGLSTEYGVKL